MAKKKTQYRCQSCGHVSARWLGRCPGCEAWSTLVEEATAPATSGAAARVFRLPEAEQGRARSLRDVETSAIDRIGTGSSELDRVLGGGLVPGALALVGGAPGIGKSTLLLQTAMTVAEVAGRVLYVSGEESLGQLKGRAQRLGDVPKTLEAVSETSIERVVALAESVQPALLVVDSIQSMFDAELASAPGSVAQVRECAARLMYLAKSTGLPVLMVGHTTKDGNLAGPRVLEHLVDAVLELEASAGHEHRILRSRKNRFGSTRELGVFEMTEGGMTEVLHPSELFLADRAPPSPGAAVTATLEGSRPLLAEVQALTAPIGFGNPRRTCAGYDGARVALLIAVLQRRGGLEFTGTDIFVNVTGGLDLTEPAADLAVALAIASCHLDRTIPGDRLVLGEVGLGGEIRAVPQPDARCDEAARLGFTSAIVPASSRKKVETTTLKLLPVRTIEEALDLVRG
jgi:DNA repair protein RadA/Sms